MEYPKGGGDNLKYRALLLMKAERDESMQSMILKKCSMDVMYFFNVFLWTYNPRVDPSSLPFITYAFQDDYIKGIVSCVEFGKDSITEKSRDMGYSWMTLGIILWGFLFKKWSCLIGSYKEDYVDSKGNMDSHFERIRYMIGKLPKWMVPEDLNSYYMTINSVSRSSEIAGDSGVNFGVGGRRTVVYMDEFALWENGEYAFRKTRDVTKCRIIGGTPQGKINTYGKIMTNHPDYSHIEIKKFRLHWSLHPLKTPEWYEEQKRIRTRFDIAQELDISYDDSVSGAVYPDFSNQIKVGIFNRDVKYSTYTSWDFGRDMIALLFWQKDHATNKLYLIDSVKRKERNINKMVAFVLGKPTQGFTYDKSDIEIMERHRDRMYQGHFGDPYNGASKTAVSDNTFQSELAKYGVYITLKRGSRLEERITKSMLALNRLSIDERNYDFMQDIIQSRYPQVSEGSNMTNENRKPVHGDESHFRTSMEYFFDNEPFVVRANQERKRRINPITGQYIGGNV